MAKRTKIKIGFCLVVTYKSWYMSMEKDKRIVRLVGRPEQGSGFCLMSDERDLNFGFATMRGAEGAKKRVKEGFGGRVKCKIYRDDE